MIGNQMDTTGPYYGYPVPLDCNRHPSDVTTWYDDFHQELYFAPHYDGASGLVFPDTFYSEDIVTRKVRWQKPRPGDDDTGRERMATAVKIYRYLDWMEVSHPKVANFLGSGNYGYRLERLRPGPFPAYYPAPHESDTIPALYQRWALQMLSTLVFPHSHDVIVNWLDLHVFWVRNDFSIAIGRLVNAGCAPLSVEAGGSKSGVSVDTQWRYDGPFFEGYSSPEYFDKSAGHWKDDLFHWAAAVFMLMTGGENLLSLGPAHPDHDEYWWRVSTTKDGTFNEFPYLQDHLLGPQLVKAWKGEYTSTKAALEDVREVLQTKYGRQISGEYMDEIDAFDWSAIVEISANGGNSRHHAELRLRGIMIMRSD